MFRDCNSDPGPEQERLPTVQHLRQLALHPQSDSVQPPIGPSKGALTDASDEQQDEELDHNRHHADLYPVDLQICEGPTDQANEAPIDSDEKTDRLDSPRADSEDPDASPSLPSPVPQSNASRSTTPSRKGETSVKLEENLKPPVDVDAVPSTPSAKATKTGQPLLLTPSKMNRASLRIPPLVERSGELMKRSPNVFHGWQPRLFVLHKDDLVYFKKDQARARGLINLSKISKISILDASLFRFAIQYGPKTFELQASSTLEMHAWMDAIENNCRHFPTSPLHKSVEDNPETHHDRTYSDKFWRVLPNPSPLQGDYRPTISSDQLPITARTGDILLFRTKGVRGGLVRKATSSDYDHAGLLLKFKNGDIGVLEALGSTGVQVSNWKGFIREGWHSQYSEIAIRQLEASLTRRQATRLEEFVKTCLGKKYSWTPIKHLRRRSSIHYADSSRTFFCSELVASAYKFIGLLRDDLRSSRYTPGAFSSAYNLHLMQGASLSHEIFVQFDDSQPKADAAT